MFCRQRDQYSNVLLTYYFTLFNHGVIVRITVLMLSHSHSYLSHQLDGRKNLEALFNWEQPVTKEKDFSLVWLFSYISSYKLVAAAHLFLSRQINLCKFLLTGAFWQKTPSDWSSLRSSSRDVSVTHTQPCNTPCHQYGVFWLVFQRIYVRYIWSSSRQALVQHKITKPDFSSFVFRVFLIYQTLLSFLGEKAVHIIKILQ